MRGLALLGGLAVVTALAVWRQPSVEHGSSATHRRSTCAALGTGYFCDALTGLATSFRDPIGAVSRATILPPPETPGAVDPAITQANIGSTICRPGYARSVRPAFAVTEPIKHRLMNARHSGETMADYELDHLIPISLGGAPFDLRDLWLQPRRGRANAGDKNALAYVLWRLVCEHHVPLRTAQVAISRDWTKAYDTYATPENRAKYHFRHGAEDHD